MNIPDFPAEEFDAQLIVTNGCREMARNVRTPYRLFRYAQSANALIRILDMDMLLFGINELYGYFMMLPGEVVNLVTLMAGRNQRLRNRITRKNNLIWSLKHVVASQKNPLESAVIPWESTDGDVFSALVSCPGPPDLNTLVENNPVKFLLSNRNNGSYAELKLGDKEAMEKAGFVIGWPTKIISHGFLSNFTSGPNEILRKAFTLAKVNVNVVHIDWGDLANVKSLGWPCYSTAATLTKFVGRKVQEFATFLLAERMIVLEDVHFIGHSLGAHTMSFACKYFKIATGKMCSKLTALDPAAPLFRQRNSWERVDMSDAVFVEVLHTGISDLDSVILGVLHNLNFGLEEQLGHVDYFFNGGGNQPGCRGPTGAVSNLFCSHKRAYEFFAEAISSSDRVFLGRHCESVQHAMKQDCSKLKLRQLGNYEHPAKNREILLVKTGEQSPFAMDLPEERKYNLVFSANKFQ